MRRLIALTIILGVAGCSDQPPVPEDSYYRFPRPQAASVTQRITDGPIFVERLIADGVYHERAILYTDSAADTMLRQHHYHFWRDTPSRLVRDQLVDYLRAAGAAPMVITSPDVAADISIFGTIHRFERELGGGAAVVVALEFKVSRRDMDEPLLLKTYETRINATDKRVQSSVDAFDEALTEIFQQLLEDMHTAAGGAASSFASVGRSQ